MDTNKLDCAEWDIVELGPGRGALMAGVLRVRAGLFVFLFHFPGIGANEWRWPR